MKKIQTTIKAGQLKVDAIEHYLRYVVLVHPIEAMDLVSRIISIISEHLDALKTNNQGFSEVEEPEQGSGGTDND